MKTSDSAAALSADRQHPSGLDHYFEIKDMALSAHSMFIDPLKCYFYLLSHTGPTPMNSSWGWSKAMKTQKPAYNQATSRERECC